MYKTNKIIWGLLFIILGIVLGTNTLNITDINLYFKGWWTLFIIVPNLLKLLKKEGEFIYNIIGLFLGIALLLVSRGIIDYSLIISLTIPFIFILTGISIIYSNVIKDKISKTFLNYDDEDLEQIVAVFSESKVKKDDIKFSGTRLDSVFGSIELDLSRTKLDKEVLIKTSNIFAGTKIIVPKNVNITIKSIPIFGGVTNKIHNDKNNNNTIYIEAFSLFGGVEIVD